MKGGMGEKRSNREVEDGKGRNGGREGRGEKKMR